MFVFSSGGGNPRDPTEPPASDPLFPEPRPEQAPRRGEPDGDPTTPSPIREPINPDPTQPPGKR